MSARAMGCAGARTAIDAPPPATIAGTRAERGRTLTRADDRFDGERVAVITHGLWMRQWGGDPGIVGRKITLAGNPYTVVGVLRADFAMPEREADVFVPLAAFVVIGLLTTQLAVALEGRLQSWKTS